MSHLFIASGAVTTETMDNADSFVAAVAQLCRIGFRLLPLLQMLKT